MLVPLLFASLLSAAVEAPRSTHVPRGQELLLNGECGNEWSDAKIIALSKGYRIKLQNTRKYVYVCIEPEKASNFLADLLVQRSNGTFVDLHASAKLAELRFSKGEWEKMTVDTVWWHISGWWATTMRPSGDDENPFLPSSAIEYQLDRDQFGGKTLRFLLSINFGKVTFPENADPKNSASWAKVDLSD